MRNTVVWLVLFASLAAPGCCRTRQFWRAPNPPLLTGETCGKLRRAVDCESDLAQQRSDFAANGDPEIAFDLALSYAWLASRAERYERCRCPELYYQAATYSWAVLLKGGKTPEQTCRAEELYHSSVARLIVTAQEQGRFHDGLLEIGTPEGPITVTLKASGFNWRLEDFQEFYPVGEYAARIISRHYKSPGLGVPIVVRRGRSTGAYPEEEFLPEGVTFAATVLLRPQLACDGAGMDASPVLELRNPLKQKTFQVNGRAAPMATDLSAPFAYRAVREPGRNVVAVFINAGREANQGLFLLEPYQKGKIPVVFTHGLLSNPSTWMDMVNDLRATPGFNKYYQVAGFRYATGEPFLRSAANLRDDLRRLTSTVDPAAEDPALQQMVLLGHSMGGLVSKLQVTDSRDQLWQAAANRPLDKIVTTPRSKRELTKLFYFSANPNVSRVVFLATPHDGSVWADRWIGRFGASLVRPMEEERQSHRELLKENRGVFSPEIQRRIPTSIDMLRPKEALLNAIRRLPIAPRVRVHTIIGTGMPALFHEPSDGVVSAGSAMHLSNSEFRVPATHTWVHRQQETTNEVLRILDQHLLEHLAASATDERIGSTDKKVSATDKKTVTTDKKTATTDKKTATTDKKTATTDKKTATTDKKTATTDKKTATTDKKSLAGWRRREPAGDVEQGAGVPNLTTGPLRVLMQPQPIHGATDESTTTAIREHLSPLDS